MGNDDSFAQEGVRTQIDLKEKIWIRIKRIASCNR